jgi:hypothetical protein
MRLKEVPKDLFRSLQRESKGKLRKFSVRPDLSPYRIATIPSLDNIHVASNDFQTHLSIMISRENEMPCGITELMSLIESDYLSSLGCDVSLPLSFSPTPDCLYPPGVKREKRERRREREGTGEEVVMKFSESDMRKMLESFHTYRQSERFLFCLLSYLFQINSFPFSFFSPLLVKDNVLFKLIFVWWVALCIAYAAEVNSHSFATFISYFIHILSASSNCCSQYTFVVFSQQSLQLRFPLSLLLLHLLPLPLPLPFPLLQQG